MDILLTVAILPGLYLIKYVYDQDKIEKEPTDLLVKLFSMGVLSIVPIIFFENLAEAVLKTFLIPKTSIFHLVECFLGVALIEEGFKYLFLKKCTWRHPAFDYRFDAIVYSVCVGMGFAVIENIFYVFEHGLQVGVMRAFTSIPGHGMFAIYMGYYYGLAKLFEKNGYPAFTDSNLTKSLLIPIALHGFYDFCLMDSAELAVVFLLFICTMYYRTYKNLRKWSDEDAPL